MTGEWPFLISREETFDAVVTHMSSMKDLVPHRKSKRYNPHLPPLQPRSLSPTLSAATDGKPHTSSPAQRDADPAMGRHLEHAEQGQLNAAAGHVDEGGGEGGCGSDEDEGAAEDGPAADCSAPDHEPEEGDVEEGDVVVDVA